MQNYSQVFADTLAEFVSPIVPADQGDNGEGGEGSEFHCCIPGSWVGSAYMAGQPRAIASGRSS